MNTNITIINEKASRSFYPTPAALADEMLEDIDLCECNTILEPSAGKGNLVLAIGRKLGVYGARRGGMGHFDLDLIELDPGLRGILKEDFVDSHPYDQIREIQALCRNENRHLTDAESAVVDTLRAMDHVVEYGSPKIVYDDFLSYRTEKQYDLILMNPPFADGDAHLLKAISMQERYGGKIRCLLNAETLRNLCTEQRRQLAKRLTDLKAEVIFKEGAFQDAERKTDVDVAFIKVDIPAPKRDSKILEHFRKAEQIADPENQAPTDLAPNDIIQALITRYRIECKAGIALIQEYMAMEPYILETLKTDKYSYPILELKLKHSHRGSIINGYVRDVRMKYWQALFHRKELFSQFTSDLSRKYNERVAQMIDYEFDERNIKMLFVEMNAEMVDAVKQAIVKLFDELTVKYHWSQGLDQNVHYFNGWATNKAHYVNKKVILPCYDVFSRYSWKAGEFDDYAAYRHLADIEHVFNYLDGNLTAAVDLEDALARAKQTGQTRNIYTKFFDVTFFKKGTMHLVFRDQKLLDRFNIFCCQEKHWLPPVYGKKDYQDMSTDEKAVIDSFHGDSTPGSGENAYAQVIAQSRYYLAPPNQQTLALPGIA